MNKKELLEQLKKEGLDLAEENLNDLVENCFVTLEKIVKITKNKYDDMLIPLFGIAKPIILKEIDKIDGEEG